MQYILERIRTTNSVMKFPYISLGEREILKRRKKLGHKSYFDLKRKHEHIKLDFHYKTSLYGQRGIKKRNIWSSSQWNFSAVRLKWPAAALSTNNFWEQAKYVSRIISHVCQQTKNRKGTSIWVQANF